MKKPPIMILGRNGHIYSWNSVKRKYLEIREVEPEELPYDVMQQIRRKWEDAQCVPASAGI
jgi:hypothetical protein